MNNRNNNVKQNGGAPPKKPFCKVCFDAKKPREVYESHWVKDREGKVTCITLNEQQCRYCYEKGHTVKFCPEVVRVNKEREQAIAVREREERNALEQKKQKKMKDVEVATKRGAFAALDIDSDDEVEVVEEWPQLVPVQLKDKKELKESRPKKNVSFAQALKTSEADYNADLVANAEKKKEDNWARLTRIEGKVNVVEQKPVTKLPELVKTAVPLVAAPIVRQTSQVMAAKSSERFIHGVPMRKKRSWADDTSSDEEDDEDDAHFDIKHQLNFLPRKDTKTSPFASVYYQKGASEIGHEMAVLSGDFMGHDYDPSW